MGVAELDRTHAFANIALTDNVVRFATARYNKNPLIVQGPGAGPEVTAAGVFADLLRVCPPIWERGCEHQARPRPSRRPRSANVAIGFDILGFSVDVLGDTRHASTRTEQPGVAICWPSAASRGDMPLRAGEEHRRPGGARDAAMR